MLGEGVFRRAVARKLAGRAGEGRWVGWWAEQGGVARVEAMGDIGARNAGQGFLLTSDAAEEFAELGG